MSIYVMNVLQFEKKIQVRTFFICRTRCSTFIRMSQGIKNKTQNVSEMTCRFLALFLR